jgi:hypothetical protein
LVKLLLEFVGEGEVASARSGLSVEEEPALVRLVSGDGTSPGEPLLAVHTLPPFLVESLSHPASAFVITADGCVVGEASELVFRKSAWIKLCAGCVARRLAGVVDLAEILVYLPVQLCAGWAVLAVGEGCAKARAPIQRAEGGVEAGWLNHLVGARSW